LVITLFSKEEDETVWLGKWSFVVPWDGYCNIDVSIPTSYMFNNTHGYVTWQRSFKPKTHCMFLLRNCWSRKEPPHLEFEKTKVGQIFSFPKFSKNKNLRFLYFSHFQK